MENVGAEQLLLNQILWNEQNNNQNNDNDPANDEDNDEEDHEGDGTLDGGVAHSGGTGDEDKERCTVSTEMELVSVPCYVDSGTSST